MNDMDWQPDIKNFGVEDWKQVVATFIYWCDHGDAEALDVCCSIYTPHVEKYLKEFNGKEPTEEDIE